MDIYIIIILLAIILILLIVMLIKNKKQNNIANDIVTVKNYASVPASVDIKPNEIDKIVFGDLNNPDLVISEYNFDTSKGLTEYDNNSIKESFKLLLNPNNFINSLELSNKFYKVKFPANYDHLMKSDGITVATALDKKGKVIPGGQGRILGKGAAIAASVWQVASIITAQKFLSDINESLVKIEKGISEIKDFMVSEMKGKIIGNLDYLKNTYTIIKSGNYSEQDINNYYHRIESIDIECSQIMSSISLRRQDLFSQIVKMDFNITNKLSISLEKKFQEIKNVLQDICKENKNYWMTLFVKVASSHTRLSMPIDNRTFIHKLEEINHLINEEMKLNEEFYLTLKSKIHSLKKVGFFPKHLGKSAEDYADKRNQLGELSKEISEANIKLCNEATSETAKLKDNIDRLRKNPPEIILELNNNGEIKNIFKPDNDN